MIWKHTEQNVPGMFKCTCLEGLLDTMTNLSHGSEPLDEKSDTGIVNTYPGKNMSMILRFFNCMCMY
jgi:hypothetical protein